MSANGQIPDFVEPTVGWRVWDVVSDGADLRLASLDFDLIWQPHQRATAMCDCTTNERHQRPTTPHRAPEQHCTCGLYAVRDPWQAAAFFARPFRRRSDAIHRVIGTVQLWGKVVEGSRGWRAAYAYPSRIVVPATRQSLFSIAAGFPRPSQAPSRIAASLGSYGVPVDTVPCSTASGLATHLLSPRSGHAAAPR